MASELWRMSDASFFLYIDAQHKQELTNIRRSRSWKLSATYQKNDQVLAYQYLVPADDYRKAKRIEKRINESVHD